MFRSIIRALGWMLLCFGAALLSHDLVRWLLGGGFSLTDLGLLWRRLHAPSLDGMEAVAVEFLHPSLWDPLVVSLLLIPAFLVCGFLGVVLLSATDARRRKAEMQLFKG